MKLKKIDLSGMKSFLFQKGERVGMAVCAGIGVLLLGMGIMKAGVSGPPYAEKLKSAWKKIETGMTGGGPLDDNVKVVEAKLPEPWPPNNEDSNSEPWVRPIDKDDENKRQNPLILKVQEDEKHLQVDVRRGGYFAYELEKDKQKVWVFEKAAPRGDDNGGGGAMRPVKIMKPLRFVVVTGVFPWKEQLDEFRKKLRYEKMADLFLKPEDLPKPLGLNVYRCELKPDGKDYTDWQPIFKYDPGEDKLEVAPRITDLFQEAFIDADNPAMLGKHVHPGLVTPLPHLANLTYPKLKLQGITLDETKKATKKAQARGGKGIFLQPAQGMKKGPGGAAMPQEPDTRPEPWAKFPPALLDQFTGKINYFDPNGVSADPQQPNAAFLNMQRNRDDKTTMDDAIVRFIDVGVEAGKTYMYLFAVRMANPNFQKAKEVEFTSLALPKELLSEFTTTAPVTIPDEYYYYAVDHRPEMPIPDGSDTKPASGEYPTPYGKWNTPIQIHRWLSKFIDGKEWVVADWAIAERLLTRRGDPIGRYGVVTEVPVWDKNKEDFEIGAKRGKKGSRGVPIDYIKDTHPPLLVDFEGGVKNTVKVGVGSTAVMIPRDESAVEILVLTPSGKLEVRNSRIDTDINDPPGQERQHRVKLWLDGIQNLRGGGPQ